MAYGPTYYIARLKLHLSLAMNKVKLRLSAQKYEK